MAVKWGTRIVVEFLGAIQILIHNMLTGVPGVLHGLTADTAFFTGNYAPRFSLQAANLTPEVKFLAYANAKFKGNEWLSYVPHSRPVMACLLDEAWLCAIKSNKRVKQMWGKDSQACATEDDITELCSNNLCCLFDCKCRNYMTSQHKRSLWHSHKIYGTRSMLILRARYHNLPVSICCLFLFQRRQTSPIGRVCLEVLPLPRCSSKYLDYRLK